MAGPTSRCACRRDDLTQKKLLELIEAATAVMTEAVEVGGGTSFDALYVNVNGQSGYFERSLNAYGREGQPCRRCGGDHAPGVVHEPQLVLLPEVPDCSSASRALKASSVPRNARRHVARHFVGGRR